MRDAVARGVTVLNCLDSILMDNEQSEEWQMQWSITGDPERIAPRVFASRSAKPSLRTPQSQYATLIQP